MAMKVANVILSILIFIFAAVSAVFSYFLFEKRSQFVDGWAKMADTVNKTAVALDKDSGIESIAKDLSADKLSHKNYADLDKLLPKLYQRAEEVSKSRSLLAGALNTIGENVGAKLAPAKENPWGLNKFDASKDAVLGAFSDAINNRDRQFRNLKTFARNYLKVDIDVEALKSGSSSPMKKVETALKEIDTRSKKYESSFRSVGNTVGVRFDSRNYSSSVSKIVAGVNAQRRQLATANAQLKKAQNDIRNRDRQIQNNKQEISRKNATISKRDAEIRDLKKALGLDTTKEFAIWKNGSDDARKQLEGKVIEVNADYGYVVIDLGKDTRVIQKAGNRSVEVDPQIVKGLELVIVEGSLTDKTAKRIASVKVDEVGANCVTANIPPENPEIKVGYKVYWIPVSK